MAEDREYYDIAKAFAAIEAELLDSMMRNMFRHKLEENVEGKEWAQWQAVMMAELNEYKKKNRTKFKEDFEYINQMLEEAIIQARKDGNMDQEAEILEAIQNGYGYHRYGEAVNGSFFRVNDRKMDALIMATTNDMKQAETAMLRKANDNFRKVIYHSQAYMASGAATYEKAVDMAANDFLMRGIQCVKYKGGSMHNIKDYADMVLRTTTKRAYLTGEGEMRQSWGISLVILNKRTNACPKCTPFVGKVLIDDVWSGGKPDGKHLLMSNAIEQGLYHPRCKDAHTTYFGSSEAKPYTKEERQRLEDDYKKEQKENAKQRQIEGLERVERHALSTDTKKLAGRKKELLQKDINKAQQYLLKQGKDKTVEIAELDSAIELMPQKIRDKAKAMEVRIGVTDSSKYDYNKNIMYLAEGAKRSHIIHEFGHMAETLIPKKKVDELKKKIIGEVYIEDLTTKLYYDNKGGEIEAYLLKNNKFVSEYQGRIYSENLARDIANGDIMDLLYEFISEPFKEYVEHTDVLREKYREYYDLFQEVFNGE